MILSLAWTCRSGWGVGAVFAAGWLPHPVKSTTRTPKVSTATLTNAKNDCCVLLCIWNIVSPPSGSCFHRILSLRVENRLPTRSLNGITAMGRSITRQSQLKSEVCLLSQSDHEKKGTLALLSPLLSNGYMSSHHASKQPVERREPRW